MLVIRMMAVKVPAHFVRELASVTSKHQRVLAGFYRKGRREVNHPGSKAELLA